MRTLGATLALALVSCGTSPQPAPKRAVTITLPTASTVASPPPARDIDVCARVNREMRAKAIAAIAAAPHQQGEAPLAEADVMTPFDQSQLTSCRSFAGGAWALEFVDGPTILNGDLTAQAAVVAYVHNTRIVSARTDYIGAAGMFKSALTMLAGDYDGDGIPEFFVHLHEDGVEGGQYNEGFVVTISSGAIVEYAPAAALGHDIGTPRDVDGDGRLDIPTAAGILLDLDAEASCEGKPNLEAAHFVAHSLPNGDFSIDDEVAKRHARAWCPAPPAAIKTSTDALCTRLWAKTPVEVVAARKRVACVPWDCALASQKRGADGSCQFRLDAFDATPPFTLP